MADARPAPSPRQLRLWVTILVAGAGISSIGDFIYLVAINVLVLERTHSVTAVAGLWAVSRVAALVVGPWAGSVTDRYPRREQLILIELCRAALLAVLPLLSNVILMYADLFLLGAATVFFQNASLPYRTALIPADKQKRVNALSSTLQFSAFITGPAIAGALMAAGHLALPLWLDAVSFLGSALSFLLLPGVAVPQTESHGSSLWRAVRDDARAVWAFLRDHATFLTLYILFALMMLLGSTADAQEVVFAQEALHLGQLGYGMMVTAAGVGFVAGSVLLSLWAHRLPTRLLVAAGAVLNAGGYLVYACAQGFWSAVTGLVILGIFGSALNVGWTTYMQRVVPVAWMGRLNNVVGPPQQVLTIVFMLLGGVVSGSFGVRALMVSMTILMTLASLVLALLVNSRSGRTQMADVDLPAGGEHVAG
ncbi:MAG: MFS transporter [Thermoflavifilum sp.]|nr:MFS transporter [Thermoflavifilum sp.]MCL6514540.1 MFS transporter [Alicyclobacillus sp.]